MRYRVLSCGKMKPTQKPGLIPQGPNESKVCACSARTVKLIFPQTNTVLRVRPIIIVCRDGCAEWTMVQHLPVTIQMKGARVPFRSEVKK